MVVLAGYVYGARSGFLLGALTLLVSAIITGGGGPWLPYQMFPAGWCGMTAPSCRPVVQALHGEDRRTEVVVLAIFGGVWGLLFGLIMNIWFWPFAAGPAEMYWQPGVGLWATVQRYLVFYLATSLLWDLARAFGNVLLILLAGASVLRVLRRFQRRFAFDYRPAAGLVSVEVAQ